MDSEALWAQWHSLSASFSFSSPFSFSVCLAALTAWQLWAFFPSSKWSNEPLSSWYSLCLSLPGCFSEVPPNIWLTKTKLFRRQAERNKEEFPALPCVRYLHLLTHTTYALLTTMTELSINNGKGKKNKNSCLGKPDNEIFEQRKSQQASWF